MRFCKNIICFLLIISIGIGITSCYSDAETNTDTDINNDSANEMQVTDSQSETEADSTSNKPSTALQPLTPPNIDGADYSIIKHRGQDYIVFNDEKPYEMSQQLANVEFSSIKEMKNAVTKGTLTNDQKNIVVDAFERDNAGILICDFNNLYEPTLPDGCAVTRVYWSGKIYGFSIGDSSNGMFGNTQYLPKDSFYRRYEYYYEDFLKHSNVVSSSKESLGEGKTAIYYDTGTAYLKKVKYSLSSGEKTIKVDKTYRLASSLTDPSVKVSSTVPVYIKLYVFSNNVYEEIYNYVYLSGFTADPDDSWLLQFGLTPYVEKGDEIT